MPEDKEILIVDDVEENIAFMSEILEEQGYPHRTAMNGKEALDAVREKTPDLILLDIMMPRKSGLLVWKELKRDPELKKIPIIIVTGVFDVTGIDLDTGAENEKDGYADDMARRFGAVVRKQLSGITPDGLIEKPIDPPVLVAKIKELLS